MAEDFLVARNPDADSKLPYLVRVPLPGRPVVLKAREPWPRTSKVYCHRAEGWPADADVVERVPVRSCERRGGAIDLVLDRARENRSQFVMTRVRGREAIFWQSARTAKQARPAVRTPTARAGGLERFTVLVDAHERYPYRFSGQQVDVQRRALPAGDYGVELDGALVASVERKSLPDLTSSLTSGRLRYAMGELAALPRAAVVVEDRWSQVFKQQHVRPSLVADGLAELAARYPAVPVFFAETRPLAEEWTYRWLAAALVAAEEERGGSARLDELVAVADLPAVDVVRPEPAHAASPPVAVVRAWALAQGLAVSDRGRLRADVVAAFLAAQQPDATSTPARPPEEGPAQLSEEWM